MGDTYTYAPEEVTEDLRILFAAPLIISTAAFMIYGVNICQLMTYFQATGKRDRLLTKLWVGSVGILTSVSIFYQLYFNWTYSISAFVTSPHGATRSILNGDTVVFYSAVVMMVQLFWLGVIKRMMSHKPQLARIILAPIAFASVSSFILSIAVAVISRLKPGRNGSWPTPEICDFYIVDSGRAGSITAVSFRSVLGLDLAVDVSVLIIIVTQLTILKRQTVHLRTTLSKLSWFLIGTTLTSTVFMIAELYVELPQPAFGGGTLPIVITFSSLIPTIYASGFFSVLNARADLWSERGRTRMPIPTETGSRGLIPGLRFTVDLPDSRTGSRSRQMGASEPVMTFVSTRRRSGEREAT